MPNKKVVVLPGDDAAPEAMGATMDALRALKLPIDYLEFPPGEKWVRGETDAAARKAIDGSDTTLFGSTSGKTTSITYLRWGKQTFANVRPVRYSKGFHSPLAKPDGIDFVIVRENLEDLYLGLEGPLEALAPLKLMSKILRAPLDTSERGIYAIKVITERATRRVAEFACQLAVKRKRAGGKGKLTCTSKYNMLRESDGLFRKVVEETAARYPEIKYEQFIVDDFARRLVQSPHELGRGSRAEPLRRHPVRCRGWHYRRTGPGAKWMLRRGLRVFRIGARHGARHHGARNYKSFRHDDVGRA